MPMITTPEGFAIRLGIAVVLGIIMGSERQLTKHKTGILTNVIVCVGAFAFTSFSFLAPSRENTSDFTRVAAQIVSGIGFLGAGVIISDGTKIKGINTAASIWASAAVGILCCLDNPLFAIMVALTIVVSHLVIHPITDWITKNQASRKRFTEFQLFAQKKMQTKLRKTSLNICENLITFCCETCKCRIWTAAM